MTTKTAAAYFQGLCIGAALGMMLGVQNPSDVLIYLYYSVLILILLLAYALDVTQQD